MFLSQVNFARRKGSKDKKKRKLRALLGTATTLGTIGTFLALPVIGAKLNKQRYLWKNRKFINDRAKQIINTSKLNVYGDTVNSMLSSGSSVDNAFGAGQRAVNEYDKLQNFKTVRKSIIDSNPDVIRAEQQGAKYGLYGQAGLSAGLLGRVIYKSQLKRQERNKNKKNVQNTK
jgi:hypothetical protein